MKKFLLIAISILLLGTGATLLVLKFAVPKEEKIETTSISENFKFKLNLEDLSKKSNQVQELLGPIFAFSMVSGFILLWLQIIKTLKEIKSKRIVGQIPPKKRTRSK